jgi:flagellar hook-associated protein 3 FlgL
MRVSSGMLFDSNVATMQRQSAALRHTQQQVATGRRILTPADDPVAAARALEVTQAREMNSQYRINQNSARSALGLAESQLAAVGELIQNVQERAVQAGNPTLSASDRAAVARDLRARFDQLLGLANSTDGSGQSLFAGYQGQVTPFSGSVAGGVRYAGDDGQRAIQVAASRQIAVSDAGSEAFMRIRNGNGTFSTTAVVGNTGSGQIDAGNAVGAYAGGPYTIRFLDNAGQLGYTVTDAATGATSAPVAYRSGHAIQFAGQNSVTIAGTPAAGDRFRIERSANQSLFDTIANLISAIEAPVGPAGTATQLSNRIGEALINLSNGLDKVLSVRANVGSRLAEIDALQGVGEDLHLQYEQTLSRLQDLDYAEAISQLTREQTNLEAAQKSFARISQLSLFNYL